MHPELLSDVAATRREVHGLCGSAGIVGLGKGLLTLYPLVSGGGAAELKPGAGQGGELRVSYCF